MFGYTHALAGFFRGGKKYQPTGHHPKWIRLTGFLSWDDDHNGSADVGPTVDNITPGDEYHPLGALPGGRFTRSAAMALDKFDLLHEDDQWN